MARLFIYLLFLIITTMAKEKASEELLHDSNTKFTAKMFYNVAKSKPEDSVVLSAFSVMPPLAQLSLASIGQSHDEILEALYMPLQDEMVKEAFSSAKTQLKSTNGVTLKTANKVYIAENLELNTDFTAVSQQNFGSEVENINFANNKEAADKVNSWVENQTNHRIKNLVDPNSLNKETKALLVNAIYFKGIWKEPFNKLLTSDQNFHVTKDKIIQVPTMYREGNYRYAENNELNAQILEIPYGGDESSFIIVLPRDVDGINQLEEKLTDPTILENAVKNLFWEEVKVYIPKFKIESTTDLKKILEKMNITKLFIPGQARLDNFLKNTDNNLFIDNAIQKAFIEINEEGAEAAAANVFGMVGASAFVEVKEPPVFKADRPFYFEIRSNSFTIFNGVMRKG